MLNDMFFVAVSFIVFRSWNVFVLIWFLHGITDLFVELSLNIWYIQLVRWYPTRLRLVGYHRYSLNISDIQLNSTNKSILFHAEIHSRNLIGREAVEEMWYSTLNRWISPLNIKTKTNHSHIFILKRVRDKILMFVINNIMNMYYGEKKQC